MSRKSYFERKPYITWLKKLEEKGFSFSEIREFEAFVQDVYGEGIIDGIEEWDHQLSTKNRSIVN